MADLANNPFLSEDGARVFKKISEAVNDHGMLDSIKRGVLVGLSGGADSVTLLYYLAYLREEIGYFPILAIHVNHSIRGSEADRDEEFSREISSKLGVEFISKRINVPSIAKSLGKGLEECARDERYSCFRRIISGRNDIFCISTAHNSDDNAETVMLNILRGAGTRGASGIPPVRDNIIRPLIYLKKSEIVSFLNGACIPFVTDSTNLSIEYKRNYIRNVILKELREISDSPEDMFMRFSKNLRCDDDYINSEAKLFLKERKELLSAELSTLHTALLLRVLSNFTGITITSKQLSDIKELLCLQTYSYNLKGDVVLVCEQGRLSVRDGKEERRDYCYLINNGVNEIPAFSSDIILSSEKISESSLNVYKFSIQQNLSSAIINGRLFLRPRKDGDTIYYGGMTHKVKKLFTDNKIPESKRDRIPLLCDGSGVVWIPGFAVRDDGNKDTKDLYAALGIKSDLTEDRFFLRREFSHK